jgi:hypothetical protein
MKLLNIKIIMGLIVATSMGFLPQLCASSQTPTEQVPAGLSAQQTHTQRLARANAIIKRHFADKKAVANTLNARLANEVVSNQVPTNKATVPAAITLPAVQTCYHLPVRVLISELRNLLTRVHRQGKLPSTINWPMAITAQVCIMWMILNNPNMIARQICCAAFYINSLSIAYSIIALIYNQTVYNKILPQLIAATSKPHYLQIPQTAEILTTTCSICTENLLSTENQLPLLATNCNTPHVHIFHQVCLNEWLVDNTSCPECRARVPDPGLVTITNPDSQPTAAVDHAHAD